MKVLHELRGAIDQLRADGRKLAYVVLPPAVWELARDEYVAETGRMGPLEVNGREVLGIPVRADPAATEIVAVEEDADLADDEDDDPFN
jgi:hypothetical protein